MTILYCTFVDWTFFHEEKNSYKIVFTNGIQLSEQCPSANLLILQYNVGWEWWKLQNHNFWILDPELLPRAYTIIGCHLPYSSLLHQKFKNIHGKEKTSVSIQSCENGIFFKSSFYTKMICDPKYNFSLGQKYLVVASFKDSIFHQIEPHC